MIQRREYKKILELLNSLPKNKPIIVEWFDASTTTHTIIDSIPLPNYYVETRRRTIGSFICLQKGRFIDEPHLILELEHADGMGSSIRSIPLCLIYNVIVD